MGLQQDLNAVTEYRGLVREALALVKSDWDGIVPTHAAALAALDPGEHGEAWDAYLAALTTTFQANREPAGLGATKRAAYRARCGVLEAKAKARMVHEARAILDATGSKAYHAAEALTLLQRAAATSSTVLEGDWCVDLMLGVHHGFLAGGAKAFAVGVNRDLFKASRNLERNSSPAILAVIDELERPSDAVGLQLWRDARARLVDYVAGLPDADAGDNA